jgi:cytoskeleton protein RodZ
MPDIGASLREERMRSRIDITEIEAQTKIRAKYLRALENEEWDLLPGPTYVKTFLRTYADALGLDGRMLVEEYKLRHERLSDVDLQPISPRGARERARERSRRSRFPRFGLVAIVIVGLVVALYALGRGADDSDGPTGSGTPATTTATTAPRGTPVPRGRLRSRAERGAIGCSSTSERRSWRSLYSSTSSRPSRPSASAYVRRKLLT